MGNFLNDYLEYTKDGESPENFWRWSAIGAVSAALRDHVRIEKNLVTVFPNVYVILVARSGTTRKAAPCKFAFKLLTDYGHVRIIDGRASIQGAVEELSMVFQGPDGLPYPGASGLLYSEELAALLVDDASTVPTLIDLYDNHKRRGIHLRSFRATLENVCLSLLAASNDKLLADVFNDAARQGGLLGRTFLIHETRARHRKSLFDLPSPSPAMGQKLADHIQRIGSYRGPVEASDAAIKACNSWYYSMPEEVMSDEVGFASRLQTHVLKVALILATMDENFDMKIQLSNIEQAIELVNSVQLNYQKVASLVATSRPDLKVAGALIVNALLQNGRLDGRGLSRLLYGRVEPRVKDVLLENLKHAGLLDVFNEQGVWYYSLTPEGRQEFAG